MTDKEMQQQYKDVLYEIDQLSGELAHLRHKAETLGEGLEQFGRWMKASAYGAFATDVNGNRIYAEPPISSDRAEEYFDYDALTKLISEIRAKDKRTNDLEQRKSQMRR